MGDDDFSQSGLPLNSQYTDEQVAELKKLRAARLKLLNIAVTAEAVLFFGFIMYLQFRELSPMKVLGISFTTLVIACVVSSALLYVAFIYFGRCPGCNHMYWKKVERPGCIYCGLDLGSPGASDA